MIWVGGGIIVHGLETYGLPSLSRAIHAAAEAAARALPSAAGAVEWTVTAAGSGLVGLLIGAAAIPVIGFALAPAWTLIKRTLRGQTERSLIGSKLKSQRRKDGDEKQSFD